MTREEMMEQLYDMLSHAKSMSMGESEICKMWEKDVTALEMAIAELERVKE